MSCLRGLEQWRWTQGANFGVLFSPTPLASFSSGGGKFKVMGGSTTNWLKLDLRSFFSEP